jgi:hypothetical protein
LTYQVDFKIELNFRMMCLFLINYPMSKMKSPQFSNHPVDAYFNLLENLSSDEKRELISRLSKSIQQKGEDSDSLRSLFGAFVMDQSADDMLKEIRASRTFHQNRAGFSK